MAHLRVCESQSVLYLCNLHTAAVFAHRPLGCCSIAAQHLGNLPWCLVCCPCRLAIRSSNRAYISPQARRRAQHTYDADPNARRIHHGDQHHDPVSFFTLIYQVESVTHFGSRPGTNWTSKPGGLPIWPSAYVFFVF